MCCRKLQMFVCVSALTMTLACVGSAKAYTTIYQNAAVQSFNGLAASVVTLPDTPTNWTTGGVHLQFDFNPGGGQEYLWASDIPGYPTPGFGSLYIDVAAGFGRLRSYDGGSGSGDYTIQVGLNDAIDLAGGYHSIAFDFVNGGNMVLTVDGVSSAPTASLVSTDFSPSSDHHLGYYDVADGGYVGNMRNVLVYEGVPAVPGDYNGDTKVDAADYVIWRINDGTSNALANDNGLGVPITSAHYDLWRANFGNPPGAGAGGGLNGAGAVPEPSAFVLLFIGAAGMSRLVGRARVSAAVLRLWNSWL